MAVEEKGYTVSDITHFDMREFAEQERREGRTIVASLADSAADSMVLGTLRRLLKNRRARWTVGWLP